MPLFALFVAVPLIEIALFIQIGGAIGLWPTLAVVVLTALLGTILVRQQGGRALDELRQSLNDLRNPSEPLAHGAMILVSGALLLTPGFFTDAVGFLLLVPQVRAMVFEWLKRRIRVQRFEMGRQAPPQDPHVVEGEYRDVTPTRSGRPGNSGWTKH